MGFIRKQKRDQEEMNLRFYIALVYQLRKKIFQKGYIEEQAEEKRIAAELAYRHERDELRLQKQNQSLLQQATEEKSLIKEMSQSELKTKIDDLQTQIKHASDSLYNQLLLHDDPNWLAVREEQAASYLALLKKEDKKFVDANSNPIDINIVVAAVNQAFTKTSPVDVNRIVNDSYQQANSAIPTAPTPPRLVFAPKQRAQLAHALIELKILAAMQAALKHREEEALEHQTHLQEEAMVSPIELLALLKNNRPALSLLQDAFHSPFQKQNLDIEALHDKLTGYEKALDDQALGHKPRGPKGF